VITVRFCGITNATKGIELFDGNPTRALDQHQMKLLLRIESVDVDKQHGVIDWLTN